jgi:dihydroorotate dehydrogenase (fumarate)
MCETEEDLSLILMAKSGGCVTKSMTLRPREGNPHPKLYTNKENYISLNSMGLPNLGYKYYCEIIPKLKKKYRKPVIASISATKDGEILEQYVEMAKAVCKAGADMIEVNTSCPNLSGDPIGMDLELMKTILEEVKKNVNIPVSVKLMPYTFSLSFIKKVADILIDSKIDCIATINSVPFCVDVDLATFKKVIRPNNGFGGFGGISVLQVALANVHWFYKYFQEHSSRKIYIFGVGGVRDGETAIKHFLVGADALQIGTAILIEGPGVFGKIVKEIEEWMENHGFSSIEEIVGIVRDL